MKIEKIRSIEWTDYSDGYIIGHPMLSPVIADPTFTFPENSPDNLWHMFAHTIWGIHHYISGDGIKWEDRGLLIPNAMRSYLYIENGRYYLIYEKYKPLSDVLAWVLGIKWYSQIVMKQSIDLKRWTDPVPLIKPELDWHISDGNKSVSNPCLVKNGDDYYLYYSAALVNIKDCGFSEPDCIGLARSKSIMGPYESLKEPIIRVNKQDPWCNLSCGSIKVLAYEDGFVGFENGIYWDDEKKQSGSAILMLESKDGIKWERNLPGPILKPSTGWRRSHIYACDVRYYEKQKAWYLYYNARDDWYMTRGRERIGLLIGKL